AQPMITSSISDVSSPGTRVTASLITVAPISSGRVVRNVPFGALPTAVLTADTITASLMLFLLLCILPGFGLGFLAFGFALQGTSKDQRPKTKDQGELN